MLRISQRTHEVETVFRGNRPNMITPGEGSDRETPQKHASDYRVRKIFANRPTLNWLCILFQKNERALPL
jgi:hypothetical protein